VPFMRHDAALERVLRTVMSVNKNGIKVLLGETGIHPSTMKRRYLH
jgi:hypothetical protein